MTPAPTKPPRLPKGRVLKMTITAKGHFIGQPFACEPGDTHYWQACIPCKTAREAKQVVRLHANLSLESLAKAHFMATYDGPHVYGEAERRWEKSDSWRTYHRARVIQMFASMGINLPTA